MVVSESSFGAYVCLRRPVGSTTTSGSCYHYFWHFQTVHLISDLGDLLEQGKVNGMYTCGLGSIFLCVGSIFFFTLSLFFLSFCVLCEGHGNRLLFIEHLVCEMKMFFFFAFFCSLIVSQ